MPEFSQEMAADSSALEDSEVVAGILAGQLQLFGVLMRRHNQRLYRAVRSILGSDADAEDAVQEAYVRAYQHLEQFEGRSSFATWLTRIAVHEALARLRKQRRLVNIESTEASGDAMINALRSTDPGPEEQAMARSVSVMLESAVDSLPPAYRSVFMLREIEGLSTGETAECLEMSEDAVKVRLHRGRAMLRREIFKRTGESRAAAFQFAGPRCDALVAAVLARIQSLAREPR